MSGGLVAVALALLALPAQTQAQPAGFQRVTVVDGLDQPTAFAFRGDAMLVTEKASGKVQVVRANGTLRASPYLTLSVDSKSERGVVGIAVDPDFASNGFVYVYYTTGPAALDYGGSPANRVSRFTSVDGFGTGETILLDNIPSDNGNHNGGDLQFGVDGYLYVAVGDGGVHHSDALGVDTLRGKILRINRNGKIPAGNPHKLDPAGRRCGKPGGVPAGTGPCREIYARGLRNPFRLSPRALNGTLLIGDVGEQTWEEIDTLVADGNYGWPDVEGPCPLLPGANCDPSRTPYPAQYEAPIHFYNHAGAREAGRTIIAGAFAENATAYPAPYAGAYFYGDFSASWIHVLSLDAENRRTSEPLDFARLNGPVALKNGPDGNIYVLSFGDGALYKYTFTP